MAMQPGISTACFYPETTEASLRFAAEAGARLAEVFINAGQEFTAPFFDTLARIAADSGIKIVSVHPFTSGFEPMLFFSNYPRRFQDGLELYRRCFALAAQVGARYFVIHGAAASMTLTDEETYERFGLLAQEARRAGLVLLQENVVRCRSRDPQYLRGMRAYLGDLARFVLDTKQALRSRHTALEMLEAMGGALRHVHISDYCAASDCVPPGKGEFDIPAFLSALKQNGYGGAVILELYSDSYGGKEELAQSLAYLSAQLKN